MEKKPPILSEVVERITKAQLLNDVNATPSQKYFELKSCTEKKVIGRQWPQVDSIDLSKAHSLEYKMLPKHPIDFGRVKMYDSAKVTDFISTLAISSNHVFINEHSLDIINGFDLGNYILHPAKVVHKSQLFNYHILQFSNNLEKHLDFESSQFFEADILGCYEGELEVNSFEEFMKIRQEKSVRLLAGKFKIGTKVPDLFTIQCSNVNTYISKELAEAFVKSGLTGFVLKETTTLID